MESGVLYPEIAFHMSAKSVTLLDILKEQKASKYSGGIYHKTQIDLTYYSNHIEGSRMTHDQPRYIFEVQSACRRLLGQSICRLYTRLQVLLCFFYEALYRTQGGMGHFP